MQLLGTIVAANGSSTNNTTTATAFTIYPAFSRVLIVTPSASGVTFYVTVGTLSTLAAASTDFGLSNNTSTQIECPKPPPSAGTVVAIFPSGGSGNYNITIYGLYGSATS